MDPAQGFFNGRDEVFLVGCKVNKGVGYVFNARGRGGSSPEKVRSRSLGGVKTFMKSGKRFEGETKPGSAVVCAVWGVERGGE
jgi:hypothetical protein